METIIDLDDQWIRNILNKLLKSEFQYIGFRGVIIL